MPSKSETTLEGLAKAAKRGRFPGRKPKVPDAVIRRVMHLGTAEAAREAGLSKSQFIARRRKLEESGNDA